MSFYKAIAHGKEHRKPYRGAEAVDTSCRPHGGCPWCTPGRQHNTRKWKQIAEDTREQYFNRWQDELILEEIIEEEERIEEEEWLINTHNLIRDYEYQC